MCVLSLVVIIAYCFTYLCCMCVCVFSYPWMVFYLHESIHTLSIYTYFVRYVVMFSFRHVFSVSLSVSVSLCLISTYTYIHI